MTRKLLVSSLIPQFLTQKVVVELFKIINTIEDDKIILDFEGIEYMSVYFAQQYQLYKKHCTKTIKEINLHEYTKLLSIAKNLFEY